jgi:exosortase
MTGTRADVTPLKPEGPSGPGLRTAVHALQTAAIALLLGLAYWPVIYGIVEKWANDGNWSHGWLVPLFSLYFLYMRREQVARVRVRTSYLGLLALLLVLAAYFYFLFVLPMGYPRCVLLVATIASIVWFVLGSEALRVAWLPIAFLLFAMPLPDTMYAEVTLPLRKLASEVSAVLLATFVSGLHTGTSGVVIDYIHHGTRGSLNVEEACSGMRLMMAFVTLGVAMAYLGDRPLWQRAIMVLACIPIAVFCNIIRVSVTGFLHVFGKENLAEGTPHALLGLAMLPIALGLFALLGYILDHLFVEVEEAPDTGEQGAS